MHKYDRYDGNSKQAEIDGVLQFLVTLPQTCALGRNLAKSVGCSHEKQCEI